MKGIILALGGVIVGGAVIVTNSRPAQLPTPTALPSALSPTSTNQYLKNRGPAPAVRLTTKDGAVVTLADYRGKVVVINFWASWCPNCRNELPEFVDYFATAPDKDKLTFIAVNWQESRNDALEFARSYRFEPNLLLDSDGSAFFRLGATMPSTFVLNPQGEIVAKYTSQITKATLGDTVNTIVNASKET